MCKACVVKSLCFATSDRNLCTRIITPEEGVYAGHKLVMVSIEKESWGQSSDQFARKLEIPVEYSFLPEGVEVGTALRLHFLLKEPTVSTGPRRIDSLRHLARQSSLQSSQGERPLPVKTDYGNEIDQYGRPRAPRCVPIPAALLPPPKASKSRKKKSK